MYSSALEFISCYLDDKLNEYNKKLTNDYVEFNFYDKHFYEENVDIKYVDGCFCYLDDIENCECEDEVYYYYDDFMLNKIPMFPKNKYFQEYYENIFPKRIFDTKVFYYLPNGCKSVTIKYIDKTIDTVDISRKIIYYFINDTIALIEDCLEGWFGNIYKHYHTSESEKINSYMEILNNSNIHSDDVKIVNY